MIGQTWMKWAALEACTKNASKILQKIVGNVSLTWTDTFLATAIIGLVQTIVGGAVIQTKKISLFPGTRQLFGCCLFGLLALASTVLSFGAFLGGGEVGVNTFIITLSIIPETLIDAAFFRHKITPRETIGISVAILAGYVILGSPSLTELIRMPMWIWLSFATALTVATNQGVARYLKEVNPFVKNFWGGLVTLIPCACIVVIIGDVGTYANTLPTKLLLASLLIGLIVVGMWSFSLMSYRGGASIAFKKLVTNGIYLTMATICGALLFGEKITAHTLVGIALYIIAFMLVDNNTWKAVTKRE